jgi:hypothetical protein
MGMWENMLNGEQDWLQVRAEEGNGKLTLDHAIREK